MTFYDGHEIMTAAELCLRGYIVDTEHVDLARLAKAGILPVKYNYPPVPDTYEMEPDGLVLKGDHYERTFHIVDASLETARQQLLAKVADLRWKAETGGIDFQGVRISTDRQSQAMISQTVAGLNLVNSTDDKIETVRFKSDSGFVELTPEEIAAIGIAVTRHVEKCYSLEAELCEEIETAPDLEALRAVDLSFEV